MIDELLAVLRAGRYPRGSVPATTWTSRLFHAQGAHLGSRFKAGALHDKLMRKDFFDEFCREFAKEMNRLRMEHRAGLTAAKRELVRLEARRKKLVELVMDGVPGREVKDELIAIGHRRDLL